MAPPIHPVILCGGAGMRLWPLSRPDLPKQFLCLTSDRSLLQETALRLAEPALFAPPLVVCNAEHRHLVIEQLQEAGVTPLAVLVEPEGRNTGPAIAAAAHFLACEAPGAVMSVHPSDHCISGLEQFHAAVRTAGAAAAAGFLVTFGVAAATPETGYGYIRRGSPMPRPAGCFRVDRFVEKPDFATAVRFLEEGGYDWNSGMFAFQTGALLDELARHAPEIGAAAGAAIASGHRAGGCFHLEPSAFAGAPRASIDHAVMQRTDRAVVVPARFGWSDVGSWASIWELGDKDDRGNLLVDNVIVHDVRNSYVRGGNPLLAVAGLSDVVVVATDDAVLVAAKDRVQDVKVLAEQMRRTGAGDAARRPSDGAGLRARTLDVEGDATTRRLSVAPGAKVTIDGSGGRRIWVVVSGTGQLRADGASRTVASGDSIAVSARGGASLSNAGTAALNLIEVAFAGPPADGLSAG